MYCRASPQTPTGKDVPCTSNRKWLYFTTTSRKKKDFLLAFNDSANKETVKTRPMKSHYTLNSQFPPMKFLFIRASLKFHFSSIKEFSFLFFIRTAWDLLWLHVPNCSSLLLPNKLQYAGKITEWFRLWIPCVTATKLQSSQEQKHPEMYKTHIKKIVQIMEVIKMTWTNEVVPCFQRRHFKIWRMSSFPELTL